MALFEYFDKQSGVSKRRSFDALVSGSRRSIAMLATDIAACGLAFILGTYLATGAVPTAAVGWIQLIIALLAGVVILPAVVTYRSNLRFVSLGDLVSLAVAAVLIVTVFGSGVRLSGVTESTIRADIVMLLVLVSLLAAPRAFFRGQDLLTSRSRHVTAAAEDGQQTDSVLLVGRGTACELFLRSLRNQVAIRYAPVGIIDDISNTVGTCIHGIPILGDYHDCDAVRATLEKRAVSLDRIILTEPLTRQATVALEPLFSWARASGITVSQLPGLSALRPMGPTGDLATIDIHALLERQEAKVDYKSIQSLVKGRRVMITGAGGSIGSELVRQVASLGPSQVVLIESCELNSYQIDMDLGRHYPKVQRHSYICCIRDRARLATIFRTHRPELVFNAAALKHVPIVEANPCEGVLTNVVGARNVADLALETGALAMIQISTDKAVNTSNVMGATKRVAELYCQALDKRGGTRFMTVRFGNVLGSSGSLIPLFKRQIDEGGPLTVTDARMTRFFMTIREAVELTLLASASGLQRDLSQGQIMVLDMGEPIPIMNIAERMIRLAGMVPGRDIKIETIGIRPGEKLFEELFDAKEVRTKSAVEGIHVATTEGRPLYEMRDGIAALDAAARHGAASLVVSILSEIVPGYEPGPSASDTAPQDGTAAQPHRPARHDTIPDLREAGVV
ncbi:UDP-N-acetyl-alpha-D-glucosamine C6 dehydratase [Rhodobacteraceae bacterium THAF1]|uniref:polysaccharide biosynthesis protein n=1 Tax=Palleronia sp. THAF1 TaxID=2587842 RepID=UPI000F3F523E|nr:nucleoside-diphosphate sugar epimerase/dehydratase [Palleronia sp. THAF1]QFU10338.1 UDP-N-acetyl-alpha-D-glucosamine C6 dehydratase [Palleronia sp. THAF1]VDC31456.1 UDP-N-acetyl-alpha-D-glucosamine C6 dehydratase [Rhodobacteraceae bacterium THAF1]